MSYSIHIIGVEHIPEEQTLLIHYAITDPGEWGLVQNLSAYRNVASDTWTLIFPNELHPRHTSFPIFVANGSTVNATFAWDYGSIRGVGAESFDNEHSFLVQLTIFRQADPPVIQPGDDPSIVVGTDPATTRPRGRIPTVVPTSGPRVPPPIVPPRVPTSNTSTGTRGRIDYEYEPPIPQDPNIPGGFEPGDQPSNTEPGSVIPHDGNGSVVVDPIDPSDPVDPYPNGSSQGTDRPPVYIPFPSDQTQDPNNQGPNGDPVDPFDPSNQDPGDPVDPFPNDPGTTDPLDPFDPNTSSDPFDPYPGGGDPAGGGNGSSDPVILDPDLPQDPYIPPVVNSSSDPRPPYIVISDTFIVLDPNNNGGTTDPVDPNIPNGSIGSIDPAIIIIPLDPLGNNNLPNGGGSEPDPRIDPVVLDITSEITNTSEPVFVFRQSTVPVGGNKVDSSFESDSTTTDATSSQPSLPEDGINGSYSLSRNGIATTSSVPGGYQVKLDYRENTVAGTASSTITHLDTTAVIPGSILYLDIPKDDVPKGEDTFISAAYTVPIGVQIYCTLELWAIDPQGRLIILTEVSAKMVKTNDEIKTSYILTTYNFSPGKVTIVAIARGQDGKPVGVASKKFIVRSALSSLGTDAISRIRESKNITTSSSLPASLVDIVNINRDPDSFYVKNSEILRILIEKVAGTENKISMILVTSAKSSLDKYRIDILVSTNEVPEEPAEGEFDFQSTIGDQEDPILTNTASNILLSSNTRLTLDGEEVHPFSHTVGIPPSPMSESRLLVLIGPDTRTNIEGSRKLDLYLGTSYRLVPVTVTATRQSALVYTIAGNCSYVYQELGILVHGKNSDIIPENYTLLYAKTDVNGGFSWPSVTIGPDDYFSILLPRYGVYNPYTGKIYTEKI